MTVLCKQKRKKTHFKLQIDKPVLVIEDSRVLSQMLTSMIHKLWDCDVHVASSFSEAEKLLNKYSADYHLAMCDLCLPDAMNGEIIDLVKKANVQFIVLSGQNDTPLEKEIMAKGAVDFIDKTNINAYPYACELVGRLYKNYYVKILVVDDSKSSSQVISQILKTQNFQVLNAKNGSQALQTIEKHKDIKLVLTDYIMPEMDGIELTVKLRKLYSKEKLSIIGLSGASEGSINSMFIKNGANDFLYKTFSYNELICRVNQNIEMLEYIEHNFNLSNLDYMTQIYNRRYFFTEGVQQYQIAKDMGVPLTTCMMDIDHFKAINDNYGHDCGDKVLICFAEMLTRYFEEHLIARLGGEEFAILFQQLSHTQIVEKLNAFRIEIENTAINCSKKSLSITVSIGITNNYGDSIEDMLKYADKNLYQAKKTGRNQVIG